jgi:hypothetical protein
MSEGIEYWKPETEDRDPVINDQLSMIKTRSQDSGSKI